MDEGSAVLRAHGISKRFGPVVANNGIDFELEKGEIHAIVGENGAGKSTLMQMLYGMFRPDSGHIEINGEQVDFANVHDAIAAGVGMVHQHFMLVPEFSIERNITLGTEPRHFGMIDRRRSRQAAEAALALIDTDIDPRRPAGRLSVADQQRVEVVKVLHRGARIMILDEPTAVLTPQETESLFRTLRKLAADGVSVIFITHKLREVIEVADRVSVLRRGTMRGTFRLADVDIPTLVSLMTGRQDVELGQIDRSPSRSDVRLRVDSVSAQSFPDGQITNVSFEMCAGEIVGIAGVDGNGQNSLTALLAGTAQLDAGQVYLDGKRIDELSIMSRRRQGVAFVPEDRQRDGIPLHASVLEGLIAGKLNQKSGIAVLGPALTPALRTWARQMVTRFGIKTASVAAPPSSLSGGNQQKIVLARELDSQPKLLILAQPTRGVDVGAAETIYKEIADMADCGASVLVVSADLDELIRLTDRILVVYRGEIVAEVPSRATDREELGFAMAGGQHKEVA